MKQEIISKLDELAEVYNLELHMPPFNGTNNPFFYIGEIKHDAIKFRDFFIELDAIDIGFKYAKVDGQKNYLEIML